MKVNKKKRHRWRWGLYVLLSPFLLFFILGFLIYLPPVQRFAVDKVTMVLTEATGVDVSVKNIRLAFPLDLAVHGVVATDNGDTLAAVRVMRLNVRMFPLFKGVVDVDGLEVYQIKVDTKSWIPDVYVRGEIGKFDAVTHGVNLSEEKVHLDYALLDKADLFISLSDTAQLDTTTSAPVKWKVALEKVKLANTHLRLSMPGDSMRVAFSAGDIALKDGLLDLEHGNYKVGELKLQSGGLSYLTRNYLNNGTLGNTAFQDSDSINWSGFIPQTEGINPCYIDVHNLDFGLHSLSYTSDGSIEVKVDNFFLRERSGAQVDEISGDFSLKDGKLSFKKGVLRTPHSHFDLLAESQLDVSGRKTDRFSKLGIDGFLGADDVKTLANGFLDKGLLNAWPNAPLNLNIQASADTNSVKLDTFRIDWPNVAMLKVNGEVMHPSSDNRMGEAVFDLRTQNLSFIQSLFSDVQNATFAVPYGFSMKGKANVNGADYRLDMSSSAGEGHLSLKGKLNLRDESYLAELNSDRFPLQEFLKGSGLGALSVKLSAQGRGFDMFHKSTNLKADLLLDTLQMDQWQFGRVKLGATLAEGLGRIDFDVDNDILSGNGTLDATLGKNITVNLRSEIPDLKLSQIAAMKRPLSLGATFSVDAYTDQKFTAYGIGGSLKNLRFITADKGIPTRNVYFNFDTSSDTTLVSTSSGDMNLRLAASGSVDRMMDEVLNFVSTLQEQLVTKTFNQKSLKEVAPVLDLHLVAGGVNPMTNLIREMGYSYNSLKLDLSTSPNKGVKGDFRVSAFTNNKLLLDTMTLQLQHDTTGLVANGWVKNFKKQNKTKFESKLKTYLLDTGAGAELMVRNHDGITGMQLGILADLKDNGVRFHLYPEHPIIAFRNFVVNKDNYFYFGKDSTMRADIDLLADDGTGLRVYTAPCDTANDITISLNELNLTELSQVFPYLPSFGGMFSGDLHIIDDHKNLSAMATVNTEDLYLEGAPLGNVGMEAIYLPQSGGEHQASVYVSSDGNEVLSLGGIYRSDKEKEAFEGSAELLDFPLELLNGFLVGTDIAMSGKAGGSLSIGGNLGNPLLNGELLFNNAHMYSDVYGFDFRMDDQPVRMVDNQLVLHNYALHSKDSKNPLLLNGSLDMRDMSKVRMDFNMVARNFELINAKKQAKSLVFGKVYTDFWGSLKGSMDDLTIRGKLAILDRTDMTYILKDSPLTVDDRLHDLVQFVNFEDSVEEEEPVAVPSTNFDMSLGIQINNAALFHCNLSEDGSNYVDLEGGGDLTLRLTQQGDMRLTGRFTANSGEMKYSLPVIPLKTFKLVQGSYVDFTGDVANPTLNIAAKERMKAIVTENDQPRSVAFDVGVSITQPLDQMGLEFTIEAPEDLAVQNQLAAMTKAERGKAAVGMLATGLYLTDETMGSGGSGFKASNALTAFLQSEIQNIAGSALKTIDLTIGMENNTTATGTTTTDYSFQFAKRFWGNRISVIIGGKVSTGAEAENSAESFIDNIAVEYRLDKTASRYVRVFYERSFQDPLEGQLTKTGAGLVLRRKSDRLGDLFIFRSKDPKKKMDNKKDKD